MNISSRKKRIEEIKENREKNHISKAKEDGNT